MRIAFKILLVIAIIFMAYLCWSSIMTSIRSEKQKATSLTYSTCRYAYCEREI